MNRNQQDNRMIHSEHKKDTDRVLWKKFLTTIAQSTQKVQRQIRPSCRRKQSAAAISKYLAVPIQQCQWKMSLSCSDI